MLQPTNLSITRNIKAFKKTMQYSLSTSHRDELVFALCIYVSPLQSDLIPIMTLAMTTTASAITTPLLALTVAMCTIARNINIVIPIISNKIDWLATGAIPLTVLAPVFPVAWRHAQINRLRCHAHWHWAGP